MQKTKKIIVKLGKRSYPIIIGKGLIAKAGGFIKKLSLGTKGLIVTNSKIKLLYATPIVRSLKENGFEVSVKIVPDGERYKSFAELKKIYDYLLKGHFERSSFIIALGGGVIGDLAGFAAATYARGIHFVQIPTSLLAQVDSSVGGKVAVNHPQGKNMIGAFYQPKLVLIDLAVLSSLPLKQLKIGLAEVVKYGVIRDSRLFCFLEKNAEKILHYDFECLEHLIFRSCQIKADVVSRDEKEERLRAILNFGHTLGHALESLEGYKTLSHGEAISIGMIFAGKLAMESKLFPQKDFKRLVNLLGRFGLPTRMKIRKADRILPFLLSDKKVREGKICFVIPQRIGKVSLKAVRPARIQKIMQK